MANYRPVSNVTFMSKIVKRAVSQQLDQYLADNDLLPCYQSAYRRHHSTETAMLRVLSDVLSLLTAADDQQVTLLGLLDLSAALDCVDHQLLLQPCSDFDETLDLPRQCLHGRRRLSPPELSKCYTRAAFQLFSLSSIGVPQGSVLSPILFVLYKAEIGRIVAQHGSSSISMPTTVEFYLYPTVGTVLIHSAKPELTE